MDTAKIIQEQIYWHRHTLQGCLYASYLANNDPGNLGWDFQCYDETVDSSLVEKIDSYISTSIKTSEKQIISFIIPTIIKQDELIHFIDLIEKHPNWRVKPEKVNDFQTTISLKVRLNEIDDKGDQIYSWLIGFGPFKHFAATRMSPYTEISLIIRTKQFLKEKHGKLSLFQQQNDTVPRTGSTNDAHIADMYIDTITNNAKKDNKFWAYTKKRKRELLGLTGQPEAVKDKRARAEVTFTLDFS